MWALPCCRIGVDDRGPVVVLSRVKRGVVGGASQLSPCTMHHAPSRRDAHTSRPPPEECCAGGDGGISLMPSVARTCGGLGAVHRRLGRSGARGAGADRHADGGRAEPGEGGKDLRRDLPRGHPPEMVVARCRAGTSHGSHKALCSRLKHPSRVGVFDPICATLAAKRTAPEAVMIPCRRWRQRNRI